MPSSDAKIEEPVGEEPVGIEELISRNLLELMMS